MWVLGTELRSSGRIASSLNLWIIYPAVTGCFLKWMNPLRQWNYLGGKVDSTHGLSLNIQNACEHLRLTDLSFTGLRGLYFSKGFFPFLLQELSLIALKSIKSYSWEAIVLDWAPILGSRRPDQDREQSLLLGDTNPADPWTAVFHEIGSLLTRQKRGLETAFLEP